MHVFNSSVVTSESPSIGLDVSVNPLHERARAGLADGATKHEKSDGKKPHVTKVEAALQEAVHFRLPKEVINLDEKFNHECTRQHKQNSFNM
jgi:hypothetical protein